MMSRDFNMLRGGRKDKPEQKATVNFVSMRASLTGSSKYPKPRDVNWMRALGFRPSGLRLHVIWVNADGSTLELIPSEPPQR